MNKIIRLARNMLSRQLIRSHQFLPMKYFMLLGGFVGFLIVMTAGVMRGGELWTVVLHSSVGCVVGAVLFRVFRKVVASSVREVAMQKSRRQREVTSNA
jgi:flagellar motor component MotA